MVYFEFASVIFLILIYQNLKNQKKKDEAEFQRLKDEEFQKGLVQGEKEGFEEAVEVFTFYVQKEYGLELAESDIEKLKERYHV